MGLTEQGVTVVPSLAQADVPSRVSEPLPLLDEFRGQAILAALPTAIQDQIDRVRWLFGKHLSGRLVGIYVHGSLAFGCFNPTESDIDLIVVSQGAPSVRVKKRIVRGLLRVSLAPCPLEVSVLTTRALAHVRHPCPFEIHFGEKKRRRFARELRNGSWQSWSNEVECYEYLAAHIHNARARGFTLTGEPLHRVLPEIPADHVTQFVREHFVWASLRVWEFPLYALLTACRSYAYLVTGQSLSKEEGARWACEHVPARYHGAIERARRIYLGTEDGEIGSAVVKPLLSHISEVLGERIGDVD